MSRYISAVDAHGDESPTACAFCNSSGESISYGGLKSASDSLASWLLLHTDSRHPIVVYGHKSPLMPVCFLACAKSGHAYVPVDPAYPASRITSILDQLGSPLVLDTLGEDMGEVWSHADQVESPQAIQAHIAEDAPAPDPDVSLNADETFYILFTSGSTGHPKGVEITTECIDNFLQWMSDEYDFGTHQTFFNRAPFSFDLSVTDLVLALGRGDTMFALEREDEDDLARAFASLHESDLTFWVSTPSFAEMCLHDPSFSRELLPHVHTFFFVGETLKNETAGMLLDRFDGCTVVNGYGPTESTDLVTKVDISHAMVDADEPLPVGKVKPGTTLEVLDPDTLEQVTAGQPGELFIIGNTVGKGYFGRPDLTQAAFEVCPAKLCGNNRSYRTGDEVVLDTDGMLHFRGRLDFQVKLHGFRIELGDIESNLEALPEVKATCVVPVVRKGAINHLAAYVVPTGDIPDKQERFAFSQHLKDEVGKSLPAYMVPRKFAFLDSLPLNVNGKIDRKTLQEENRR